MMRGLVLTLLLTVPPRAWIHPPHTRPMTPADEPRFVRASAACAADQHQPFAIEVRWDERRHRLHVSGSRRVVLAFQDCLRGHGFLVPVVPGDEILVVVP
jgi:hypothetical protein